MEHDGFSEHIQYAERYYNKFNHICEKHITKNWGIEIMKRITLIAILLILTSCMKPHHATAQTGTPVPNAKPQFFNGSTVCSLCILYSYSAGTSTPYNTWTDWTLGTPNGTSVTMDANGYPASNVGIYMDNTGYKFILKTAGGTTIWTMDNVHGASILGGNNTFTGNNTFIGNNTFNTGTVTFSNGATFGAALSSFDSYTQTFFSTDSGQALRSLNPTNARAQLMVTQDNTSTSLGAGGYGYFRDTHASVTRANGAGLEGIYSMGGTATTTYGSGIEGYAENTAGGTVTNLFALHARSVINSGAGTVTTGGGLLIDAQTVGSTIYSILTLGGSVQFQDHYVFCGPPAGNSFCQISPPIATSAVGDYIVIAGGTGTDAGSGYTGGAVDIIAASGTGTGGAAGNVVITSGSVQAASAQAGAVNINTGNSTGTTGIGGDITLTPGTGTTGGRSGQIVLAGFTDVTNFLESNNTVRVTTNFTTANTSLTNITGLSWATPAVARNYALSCSGLWSQATGTGGITFGIQVVNNNPTNVMANADIQTDAAGYVGNGFATLATTTATNIASGTPIATAKVYTFKINGMIELGASTNTVNIMVLTGNGSDAVTIYRGTVCHLIPAN